MDADPEAYTIEEFCEAHRFSRSMYFNLRKEGKTPREMRIGNRVVISREAAEAWRRDREASIPSER
jgi:predicted DNA-binding transcriptional regulator AlpA